MAFTENKGQLDNDNVRFYDQGGVVWFTDDGVWFELREEIKSQESRVGSQESDNWCDPMERFREPEPVNYKRVVLKQEFVGANDVKLVGRERLSWNSNFFYGNDSGKWCTGVPNYGEVYYDNLYDGIDLRYYTNEKGLKYDFIVHPGANYKQIRIKYQGAEKLLINNMENLIIKNEVRDIIDSDLFIYQNKNDSVRGEFKIWNESEYGFTILGDYNKNKLLVIDPHLVLKSSSLIGSYYWDRGHDLKVDNKGNIYLIGDTNSSKFPITPDGIDTTYNGGLTDIIILKFNNNLTKLLYSTFIGGSGGDYGIDVELDSNNNIYISGSTTSQNFPITLNAFDDTYNDISSPESDLFALKLNQSGSELLFSTYIGGNHIDFCSSLVLDESNNLIITGITNSTNFPTTLNAYDTLLNGSFDVYLLRLNHNGTNITYSSYLGGNGYDSVGGIFLDTLENIYITGQTTSIDFPTTFDAFDDTYNGGLWGDVFLLEFDMINSIINYSTYIGGVNSDLGEKIILDNDGSIVLFGETDSSDFPVTMGAYDTSYNGGTDTFILKLNKSKLDLNFSSFLGGNNLDNAKGISFDTINNYIIVGYSNSIDFPVTNDAFNSTCIGVDGFITKLSNNGSELIYSSLIGGSNYDGCNNIASDFNGNLYLIGETNSSDFKTTIGAFNQSHNGLIDTFLIKFLYPISISSLTISNQSSITNKFYSKQNPCEFKVSIFDNASLSELHTVQITLDPEYEKINLMWNRVTNKFSEIYDPNNFVEINSTSCTINNSKNIWDISFNLTFNWTYPDEDFHDVQVYADSYNSNNEFLNKTEGYSIENDLIFYDSLIVLSEKGQIVKNDSLVSGGELLTCLGLTPVYEGTTNIFPPADEFDVTLWDDDGNYLLDSPGEGEEINFQTTTPNFTDLDGYNYTINLTGIPPECDKTNTTFTIRIDGDNVTFSNPRPGENEWQTRSDVFTGITITDHGGGIVDNKSVKYSISNDDGFTWGEWVSLDNLDSMQSIVAQEFIKIDDGDDNLIKWQASDSVGNGPTESEIYRVLVDTQNVTFLNAFPLDNGESTTEKVEVGITITDQTSGVNASKIQYSTSFDNGNNWDSWKSFVGYINSKSVDVKLNLTFPNGTGNRIRWRAYDVAGNGPTISDEYVINVILPKPPIIPIVQMESPENGTIITKRTVTLSWELLNTSLTGVKYDVYLDKVHPPVKLAQKNSSETSFDILDLENGQTYYWTVLPKLGNIKGTCLSGIWSFIVEIPIPKVTLLSPANGSTIKSMSPTLTWNLDFTGDDLLSFDVYLATDKDFSNSTMVTVDENFAPVFLMDYKETYYWKVVPWAGDIRGIASEVWSFTYEPIITYKFDIELYISSPKIKLFPGNYITVKANVKNLGDLTDNISINITIPNGENIVYRILNSSTVQLIPMDSHEFDIFIQVPKDANPGTIIVNIEAISGNSIEQGPLVMKNATLVLMVSKLEKVRETDSTTENIWMTYLFLIIIIILVICVVIIIMKRKKKDEEEPPPEEGVMVKTRAEPAAVIIMEQEEQLSETKVQEQLSETTTKDETQVQEITSASDVPQLQSGEIEEKEYSSEINQSKGGQDTEE